MTSQDNSSLAEQEQQQRLQALSPVSPKPIHFSSSSNIPILEKQMDPNYNDASSSLADRLAQQGQEQQHNPVAEEAITTQYGQGGVPAQHLEGGSYNTAEDQAGSDGSQALAIDTQPPNAAFQRHQSTSATQEQPGSFVPSSYVMPESAPPSSYQIAPESSHHDFSALLPQGVDTVSTEAPTHSLQTYNETTPATPTPNLQSLLSTLTTNPTTSASTYQGTSSNAYNQDASLNDDSAGGYRYTLPPVQDQTVQPGLTPGLPPRPPTQNEGASGSSGTANDDIRQYHPYIQTQPASSYLSPSTAGSGAQTGLLPAVGTPGATSVTTPALITSPSGDAQQGQLAMNYPLGTVSDNHDPTIPRRDLDKWGPEMQRMYDKFLEEERLHVQEGQWEKFPRNSRLFVGNLSTERVTKRDLFHVFHRHGRIAQISIKQAYGFIQYFDDKCCLHALQAEQGIEIRDKKVHLEISKPQKDKKPETKNQRNRRSRSPENKNANKSDRFRGRNRDDYRPGRDSPPRRESFRNERYDGNRRSRSRSPYNDRNARYRSRSPHRSEEDEDAKLPLPRRDPDNVPDVQVLARDDPPQRFLNYIESSFRHRNIKCDVLILSPRLNSKAVMRRQILEGVLATMDVTRRNEQTQTFNMTLFNRSAGIDKINFDEYQNQPMNVIVELVSRAQKTHKPPPSQILPQNPYGIPMIQNMPNPPFAPQQQFHQRTGSAGELSNMLSNMDQGALQQLIGRMQQSPQAAQNSTFPAPPTPQSASSPFDLSKLLGGGGNSAQPPQQQPRLPPGPQSPTGYSITNPQQHAPNGGQQQFANLASNPAFAGLFGNNTSGSAPQAQGPQQRSPAPNNQQQSQNSGGNNINDIMEALAKYKR